MNRIIINEQLKEMFYKQPFFTAAGIYYGFPICCINSFIENEQFETFKKYPKHPFMGTGFVPCLDCAKESENNHLSFYEKISKNRFCPSSLFSKTDSDNNLLNQFFIDFICHLKESPIDIISEIPNSLYSIKTFLPDLPEFIFTIESNNKLYYFNIEGILKSTNENIIHEFFLFIENNEIDFYFKPLLFYIKDSQNKKQIKNYNKLCDLDNLEYTIKTTKDDLIHWLTINNPSVLDKLKKQKDLLKKHKR